MCNVSLSFHLLCAAHADFVEMAQEICRIVIDSVSTGAFQLFATVTAGKQPDTQSPRASRCEQIPDTVADDNRIANLDSEFLSGRQKQIRIGFRMLDHISG